MDRPKSRVEQVKDIEGIKVLKALGNLKVDNTPEYYRICNTVIRDEGTKAILLDLAEVEEMDTAGFACLMNFIREHMKEGIKIGIINLNRKEKALVEILRIAPAIHLFTSESEAIEELSREP
ncbi:MAG: STAS domain-containing protein [Candidatus Omnitrophota bacterium]